MTTTTSPIITGICKCNVWHTSLTLSRRLRVENRGPRNLHRWQVIDPSESLGPSSSPFMTFEISKLPFLLALLHLILLLS